MASIAYYISGHGFGHAVRAAEIIRALKRRRPSLAVHLRTTSPSWLFPPVESCEALELDSGVVQPDALRIDADATLARAADLARSSESIVRSEAKCLERLGV